jgi:integron integrase
MTTRPRLLDQVRLAVRLRHYSYRTEQQYVAWIRRFILFHGKRHPRDLGAREVTSFLSYLATERDVAAATQAQALAALLFLYRHVLEADLPWLDSVVRTRRPKRIPVVLTRAEVRRALAYMPETSGLVASLLYGGGLRLMEALRLRVKDVDLDRCQLIVRNGKGAKDRMTVLPRAMVTPLRLHLEDVRERHMDALARGFGGVELPHALALKYPRAHLDWGWQYVFPAERPSRDPRSDAWRRHHLLKEAIQRHVKRALRQAGIRTVQELLGHASVKTTQIYTHVLNQGGLVVRNPLDLMD